MRCSIVLVFLHCIGVWTYLFTSPLVVAADSIISLYSDIKPKLRYPKYGHDQRLLVAQQAKELFGIYCNKHVKLEAHGVDADAGINDIINNSTVMANDALFHSSMAKLFLSLRDPHTAYHMPKPFACYKAKFPLWFEFVEIKSSWSGDLRNVSSTLPPSQVIVSGFASDEILSLYSPEIKKRVRIGDILISYNGLSFEDFFKNHAHLTGGSNEWGGKRSAMDYMSFIDFNQYPLIKETQVVYELKRKATDAKSFIVKAPILGVTDTHCLESMHSSSRTTGTSSSTPSPAPPTKKRNSEDHDERVVHDMDLVELDDNDYNEDNDENDITAQLKKLLRHDKKRHRHSKSKPSPRNRRLRVPQTQELLQSLDLQSSSSTSSTTSFGRSYSRLRKRDRKNDLILSPTIDPSIHWTIYRHNSFKLGIIQLSTFDPVIDQSGSTTLHVIRHLLVNQLKGTHGLVFDVRDNGGGLIYIADMIPQFFSPSFEPTRFRALNSPLNRQLFESEDLANTEWADLFELMAVEPSYIKNGTFSPALALTDHDQADYFGQVYVKPVAVFTNAHCYSACDMFAAHMQDSGAGVVFGQDPRTGAGGANVVSYNDFLLNTLPYEFPPLPAGQDMTVAWRQAVRSHDRHGQLIEEVGVEPDFIVRPRIEDFAANRKESTSFARIAEKLKQIGQDTGREYMRFSCSPQLGADVAIGSNFTFNIEYAWLQEVLIVRDNIIISKIDVGKSKVEQEVAVVIKDSKEEARVDRVSIVAIDENGDLVLQTHRFLRYIPQPQHHLVLAKGVNTTWDFNTNSNSYAAIYNRDVSLTNIHSHPSQGWNYLETDLGAGAMVIGDGIQYLEKTFSAISFFLNVSSDPSQIPFVHIKLSYKMEEGIDCIVGRIRRSSQDPSDSPQNILHGVKEVDQTEDDEDDDPSVLFVLDGKGELDEDFHLSHFKGEDGLELEISFLTYDHHVVDGGAIVLEQVSFRSDQRKPVTGKSRLDKKRNNNNKRRKKIRRKQHLVW